MWLYWPEISTGARRGLPGRESIVGGRPSYFPQIADVIFANFRVDVLAMRLGDLGMR